LHFISFFLLLLFFFFLHLASSKWHLEFSLSSQNSQLPLHKSNMRLFNLLALSAIHQTRSFSLSMSASFPKPKSVVIVGGGIQGTSIAYQIHKASPETSIHILEAKAPAAAASGKGGGFMAKTWGDGGSTMGLHHLAFDMYADLAAELGCKSYRKLPVLSVSPGRNNKASTLAKGSLGDTMPTWLDGNTGSIRVMEGGENTAQITPKEFVEKMIEKSGVDVVLGECVGVETTDENQVTGVKYIDRNSKEECVLDAEAVVISAGPWSCKAEDWFDNAVELPMEGVKSTSIVWKPRDGVETDATALFCGEDNRFSTHLEVYPRPDDSIYICGIGGSDYISKEELKTGAYREECNAKENRVEAASSAFKEMSASYRKNGELDRVQACMRPCPPDALPYMGKIPGYEGAYINAGHNCWGIAWAPACGKAMAELILDGSSSSIDLRPFDPTRFTTKISGRGRKRGGESVGEQW
jgi:glycine/D-amino acid oxidase-like deaminating enzyme